MADLPPEAPRDDQVQRRDCAVCGPGACYSPRVAAVVIWAPHLVEPLNLTPNDSLRICMRCDDAKYHFVSKCASAHEATNTGAPWTVAAIVFWDGIGITVKAKRAAMAAA